MAGSRHVGKVLCQERQAAGFTVEDLALYLGVTPKTMRSYERSSRPPLHVVRLALSQCRARPLLISRIERLYSPVRVTR